MDIDGSGLLSKDEVELAMRNLEVPCGGNVVKRVMPSAANKLVEEMGVSDTHEVVPCPARASAKPAFAMGRSCLMPRVTRGEPSMFMPKSIQARSARQSRSGPRPQGARKGCTSWVLILVSVTLGGMRADTAPAARWTTRSSDGGWLRWPARTCLPSTRTGASAMSLGLMGTAVSMQGQAAPATSPAI